MEYYKVGTMVNTHGIRGEVRVIAITDFPEERFQKGKQLFIDNNEKTPVTIATVRNHKQFILVSFVDKQNINDIEKYKGMDLLVADADLDVLEDGEYYYKDIIGAKVITEDNVEVGKVKEIFETGANDVWVVTRLGKEDLLLPMIDDVIKNVDIENQLITIDLLEGLDD
ncbi:ribosome maturation factor RimM [Periweissella fabalis]|uniref:Ribosome maturation factor RimM n=1 Tax=Periweissella fabalis TaxID=1070421 RepID=A0A7X6N3M8_9LACO|nr:ribosome maturation factor RimM [Periweissella fabalis]MCM0598147.1 ribosome maturation factor RimM [Periweissella fabalis]NKZ24729.1 ribosome maturation factor RimM [Periweissella fabalis]